MSIGRLLRRVSLLLLLLSSIACNPREDGSAAGVRPASAWWLDIRFETNPSSVLGVPAGRFDPTWHSARALSLADLEGQLPPDEVQNFSTSAFAFEMAADLNGNGADERIVAGVYAGSDGSSGRLLAVVENGTPLEHFSAAGEPGFSALLDSDGEVRWYQCMECGDYYVLRWTGSSYVLE
jgi:hypothetical protein